MLIPMFWVRAAACYSTFITSEVYLFYSQKIQTVRYFNVS
jgi:hypothetical protein